MGTHSLETSPKDTYYRPSVSTDIVVFLIRDSQRQEWRRDPEKKLSVLLVRRGLQPFQGMWALPGGFLHEGETLEQCALREIQEETGVAPRVLMPCGLYDALQRDPRERVITQAYTGIMSGDCIRVQGGDDASDAAWFDLTCEQNGGNLVLNLSNARDSFSCTVAKLEKRFGQIAYTGIESGNLAFDHAAILAGALEKLRRRIRNFENVFEFMPPLFTLSALQNVIETVCNTSYTPANFRRKITPFVEETDEFSHRTGHRPAKLYRKKEPAKEEEQQ